MWLVTVLSVALVIGASASPFITTPITKLQRTGARSHHADRIRAAFLKSRALGGPATTPATNMWHVQYATSVGIGNPPTYYNLVIDTGSSNTFCGTGTPYKQTSTSIPTGQKVDVGYGDGFFSGMEYLDQVTLVSNLVIANQSIGVALSSASFQGVDGIIGVGPVDLTYGTLTSDQTVMVPTIMNNLVSQGLVEKQVLSLYFAPSENETDKNGAVTYGGIDPSLNVSEVTYVPLTKTAPSSGYWGINITSSTYGNQTIIPTSTAGIVDTGTTSILLADDFFLAYVAAIPGAMLNEDKTYMQVPSSAVPSMQPLNFAIGDKVFSLDVAAQLNAEDTTTGTRYGVVASLGNMSDPGLGFILGQKFLERFYSVYDADENRIGFAETNYTFTTLQE